MLRGRVAPAHHVGGFIVSLYVEHEGLVRHFIFFSSHSRHTLSNVVNRH